MGDAAEDGSVQMLLDSWGAVCLIPHLSNIHMPMHRLELSACRSCTPHCCPSPRFHEEKLERKELCCSQVETEVWLMSSPRFQGSLRPIFYAVPVRRLGWGAGILGVDFSEEQKEVKDPRIHILKDTTGI